MIYVPSLTSQAGRTITVADWGLTGVNLVSCEFGELLVKPGFDVLNQLESLKHYWDWRGEIILNLASLVTNASGQCVVRSIYDGRTLSFSPKNLLVLVRKLNPDYVVLPAWLLPLVSEDYPDLVLKQLSQREGEVIYETNKPAEDALAGVLYTKQSERQLRLTDEKHALCFSVMDETCQCPACQDGYTRAYFYHLYVHTPLLCYRWLVMHNQWMAQTYQLFN
jgi:queuine tRNA-ribosyltransferase